MSFQTDAGELRLGGKLGCCYPRSPRLHEFGLKPRRLRTGRPRKTTTPPPLVEVTTAHPPAAEPKPLPATAVPTVTAGPEK